MTPAADSSRRSMERRRETFLAAAWRATSFDTLMDVGLFSSIGAGAIVSVLLAPLGPNVAMRLLAGIGGLIAGGLAFMAATFAVLLAVEIVGGAAGWARRIDQSRRYLDEHDDG